STGAILENAACTSRTPPASTPSAPSCPVSWLLVTCTRAPGAAHIARVARAAQSETDPCACVPKVPSFDAAFHNSLSYSKGSHHEEPARRGSRGGLPPPGRAL